MDTLSALDVSFLHIEDDVNLMHLGSIAPPIPTVGKGPRRVPVRTSRRAA